MSTAKYEVLLARPAQEAYERADPPLARRMNRCFWRLGEDPYQHPNIKRLKGSLAGYHRYRVGDWRVVYKVDDAHREVTVLLIIHRSQGYPGQGP